MATVLTINGVGYSYPATGDQVWGSGASNWAVAVTNGMLQKAGGTFTLTANVNFGPTYGLLTAFYQSQTANPAVTGVLRLANAFDAVSWRNAANSADLPLSVNASNQLTFNGSVVAAVGIPVPVTSGGTGLTSLNSGDTLYASAANTLTNLAIGATANYVMLTTGTFPSWGQIVNASVSNAAAIAYSKLNLATSILNSDINAAAAIVYTKLSLSNSVVNADINSAAAIAYSKLNLSAAILNTDLAGAVSIAKGGTGQITATAAFNALSPLITKGDVPVYNGSNVVRQPIGSDGQVFVSDSTQANGLKWTTLNQGAKNYITYNNFENNATTGWALAHTALASFIPTTVSNSGAALAGAQYIFTITSGNATVGATYTNNAQTFTVVNTIASQVLLVCTGTGAPTASGTLTKSTGSGDATITFSAFQLTTASGNLSISTVSSNQLAGSYSLSLVSSAATVAGDMLISQAFTIDTEDQAKVMGFSGYYKVVSGAANLNFSGTSSNTYAVYIYDVTNSAWIQPAGAYNLVQNSGVGYLSGTFQTTSNSTQYQIAIVAVNASAGAATLYWDDFVVGPQRTVSAPAMGDWVAYTYTLTGSVSNPTKGTTTVDVLQWRRVGDSVEIKYQYKQSAAGSAGSGNYLIPLPLGLVADATKITPDTGGFSATVGVGNIQYTGVNGSAAYIVCYSTTQLAVIYDSGTGAPSATLWGSSQGPLSTVAVNTSFIAKVPISGWSSNTVSSADTDTRIVAAIVNGSPATAAANGIIIFPTVVKDATASYNATTGQYLVPVTGWYHVETAYFATSGSSTGKIFIYKNGSQQNVIGGFYTTTNAANGSGLIYALTGDLLDVRMDVATTGFGGTNSLYIHRLSGPAIVQATETVQARYTTASSQTQNGTDAVINYDIKDYDSHNAVTTGASWKFTAPVSGVYLVTAAYYSSGMSAAGGNAASVILYKNGSTTQSIADFYAGATWAARWILHGAGEVRLLAGDFIDLRGQNTTSTALGADSSRNWMTVRRVGNY